VYALIFSGGTFYIARRIEGGPDRMLPVAERGRTAMRPMAAAGRSPSTLTRKRPAGAGE
jgi:hypothetical protein